MTHCYNEIQGKDEGLERYTRYSDRPKFPITQNTERQSQTLVSKFVSHRRATLPFFVITYTYRIRLVIRTFVCLDDE